MRCPSRRIAGPFAVNHGNRACRRNEMRVPWELVLEWCRRNRANSGDERSPLMKAILATLVKVMLVERPVANRA
jgi:hypothetical protein